MKNKIIALICATITSTLSSFSNNQETIINTNDNLIYLIGEIHTNPECIKLKEQLLSAAKDGKLTLALEGQSLDIENEPNVFGIEDRYTCTLSTALQFYIPLALYKISKDISSWDDEIHSTVTKLIKELFNDYFDSPKESLLQIYHTLNALDTNLNTIYSQNPEIVKEFFSLYELQSSPIAYKKRIAKIVKNHSFEKPFFLNLNKDTSQWVKLYRDIIHVCLAEISAQDESFPKQIIDDIKTYMDKFQYYTNMGAKQLSGSMTSVFNDIGNYTAIVASVRLDQRNEAFLRNIINIFENKRNQRKPFFVNVGCNHAPFLYEKLTQKGYKVEMNLAQEEYNKHLEKSAAKVEL